MIGGYRPGPAPAAGGSRAVGAAALLALVLGVSAAGPLEERECAVGFEHREVDVGEIANPMLPSSLEQVVQRQPFVPHDVLVDLPGMDQHRQLALASRSESKVKVPTASAPPVSE